MMMSPVRVIKQQDPADLLSLGPCCASCWVIIMNKF